MPSLRVCRYAEGVNNVVRLASPCDRVERAGLEVAVLFTSVPETLCALKMAAALAADLNARITLVSVQVVPYPLRLERPPVYVEFLADRLRAVVQQSSVSAQVHLYFGRDAAETLASVRPAGSILVVGSERRRWLTRTSRLARQLRRRGQQVLFADTYPRRMMQIRAAFNTLRHPHIRQLAHP
jgi:hypothetical protein